MCSFWWSAYTPAGYWGFWYHSKEYANKRKTWKCDAIHKMEQKSAERCISGWLYGLHHIMLASCPRNDVSTIPHCYPYCLATNCVIHRGIAVMKTVHGQSAIPFCTFYVPNSPSPTSKIVPLNKVHVIQLLPIMIFFYFRDQIAKRFTTHRLLLHLSLQLRYDSTILL